MLSLVKDSVERDAVKIQNFLKNKYSNFSPLGFVWIEKRDSGGRKQDLKDHKVNSCL